MLWAYVYYYYCSIYQTREYNALFQRKLTQPVFSSPPPTPTRHHLCYTGVEPTATTLRLPQWLWESGAGCSAPPPFPSYTCSSCPVCVCVYSQFGHQCDALEPCIYGIYGRCAIKRSRVSNMLSYANLHCACACGSRSTHSILHPCNPCISINKSAIWQFMHPHLVCVANGLKFFLVIDLKKSLQQTGLDVSAYLHNWTIFLIHFCIIVKIHYEGLLVEVTYLLRLLNKGRLFACIAW